jgi:hypothetical protein
MARQQKSEHLNQIDQEIDYERFASGPLRRTSLQMKSCLSPQKAGSRAHFALLARPDFREVFLSKFEDRSYAALHVCCFAVAQFHPPNFP